MFKETKRTKIISAAVLILIGIILLIWPDVTTKVICTVLAIAIIALGGLSLSEYFFKDFRIGHQGHFFTKGVLLVAFGIYIFFNYSAIVKLVPTLLGFVILFSGVSKLQNGLDSKRAGYDGWKSILTCGVVTIIIALVTLLFPFKETMTMILIRIIGAGFIIGGATDLFAIIVISDIIDEYIRKTSPIDVEAVEISDDQQNENDK